LCGDADASYQAPRRGSAPRPATAEPAPAPVPAVPSGGARMIPITWLQPGAFQPRRTFDDTAIQELAASIRERGVLQPLMVRPLDGEKDSFEIICGERRWRASQVAGLHEVPVLIRSMTDREAMEIGLIENVQRQDLSPIEEAEGYRRLLDEFNHTQENLGKIVGKSRPHITNLLRLLKLPDPVKDMITAGTLSMGHARCVITAEDPEALAREVVKKGLNVRQTELLAKKQSDGRFAKKGYVFKDVDPNILALERDLARKLGLKIKIRANHDASGTLSITYSDLDQLEGVLKRLGA